MICVRFFFQFTDTSIQHLEAIAVSTCLKRTLLLSNLLLLILQIADFFAQAANRLAYFAFFKLICLFAALYLHLISFTGHLKSLRSTAKVHCPVRAPLESRQSVAAPHVRSLIRCCL